MCKQTRLCSILACVALVCLAAALFALVRNTARASRADQRFELEQAVASLRACGSCHDASGAARVTARPVVDAAQTHQDTASPAPTSVALKHGLDARLLAAGERLLDLPASGGRGYADAYADAVETYLTVYEGARGSDDVAVLNAALGTLRRLDDVLTGLEHAAHPVRLERAPGGSGQIDLGALPSGLSTHAPAAITGAVSSVVPPGAALVLRDAAPLSDNSHQGFALHHRGPPAGMVVESVFSGRLPCSVGQSPFYWIAAA